MVECATHKSSVVSLIKQYDVKKFAEIGVYKLGLCKYILRNIDLEEYWAIDPWMFSGFGYKKISDDGWDKLYENACKLSIQWFKNLHVIRLTSEKAVNLFLDYSLDMVFIDSDHRHEEVKKDILFWWTKIKMGGILSGHDYGSYRHAGVKPAVDSLLEDVSIEPGVVWWVRKICIDQIKSLE